MNTLPSISEHDLRRLLDVVSPAESSPDGCEIPEQVLRGLADLIPSACVSFFVMDTARGEVIAGQALVSADLPPDSAETDQLFFEAYKECVACCWPERSGDYGRITMLTDFYSEPEYARLKMAEYSRRMGTWHELLVCLPPRGHQERRILLARAAGDLPYTERDRLLLTLLRPHLIRLRDRVEAERAAPELTPRQIQLLRRVAEGLTNRQIARDLSLSEGTVRKHLENIYTRLEVGGRTEAVARTRHLLAG